MGLRKIFPGLVLLITLTACSNNLNDLVIVADLDDEFAVEAWEQLEGPSRSIEILFKTVKDLECPNQELDLSFRRTGNLLFIEVNELIDAEDCQPGNRGTVSRVNFGNLSPGLYSLRINLLDIAENNLLLDLSPASILLSGKNLNGLVIGREELLRIPESALWGYISAQTSSAEEALEAFNNQLNTLTESLQLPPGYYGYFQLTGTANQEVSFPEQEIGGIQTLTFLRESPEDLTGVDSLIQAFRTAYADQIQIRVGTGSGQTW
jgi:hypothetical protein